MKVELKPKWHQERVARCPDKKCKGMLLQSDYYHAEKCSECGTLWLSVVQYVKVRIKDLV